MTFVKQQTYSEKGDRGWEFKKIKSHFHLKMFSQLFQLLLLCICYNTLNLLGKQPSRETSNKQTLNEQF